jgi:hypothetical protein
VAPGDFNGKRRTVRPPVNGRPRILEAIRGGLFQPLRGSYYTFRIASQSPSCQGNSSNESTSSRHERTTGGLASNETMKRGRGP